jgi:hypothetical protein
LATNKNNHDSDKEKPEGVFEIMDGMMSQLNSTKKMVLALIITVMVLPVIAMLVVITTFDFPFDISDGDEVGAKQFGPESGLFFIFRIVIFIALLVWLVVGIRKWFVISKWSKKYELFKQRQAEIDRQFDEEDKDQKQ